MLSYFTLCISITNIITGKLDRLLHIFDLLKQIFVCCVHNHYNLLQLSPAILSSYQVSPVSCACSQLSCPCFGERKQEVLQQLSHVYFILTECSLLSWKIFCQKYEYVTKFRSKLTHDTYPEEISMTKSTMPTAQ